LVAARIGATRLLDNIAVDLSTDTAPPGVGNGERNEITWRN
jgi:pantoate--beta-alanine ligase